MARIVKQVRAFRANFPFDVPMKLLKPIEEKVMGFTEKTFPEPEDVEAVFFGSFRTFGGTENMSNDMFTIYDTGTIDTWWNPEVTAECRIYLCETGKIYDVISTPENIDMRHQFMQFKVQAVGGKT